MAAASRILVAAGDPQIRSVIGPALTAAGYATVFAAAGAEGLRQALESHYDLVLLDLVMPDADSRRILEQMLSARPHASVMVLAGLASAAAQADCLDRGARSYLARPFSLAELLTQVQARLRAEARPGGDAIRVGTLTLDTGRLTADTGHGPVPLTRLEFLLLRELASCAGRPVSRPALLAAVWGLGYDPGSNIVGACVRRLRSKLGSTLIKTVQGMGYQLCAGLPR